MFERILSYIDPIVISLPQMGEIDITRYLVAFGVLLVLVIVMRIIQRVIISWLEMLSKKTKNDLDDMLIQVVRGIKPPVYTLISLYIVLQFFILPEWVDKTATTIFLFVIAWQIINALVVVVRYGSEKLIEKDEDGDGEVDPGSKNASHMITLAARVIFWALGILFVLSNLGVEVTSLIAGLGIGGLAIAFALQNILADLFSSFSIYFDKPFRVGDYIVIGEHSGTVEKIGIKSTRLRTLQGEELVVSNAELTSARVQNFKKMEERRIVFTFGVTYETPKDKVAEIPAIVRAEFEKAEHARLDRVHFTTFGDSALIFETVYYVESANYTEYLDIQEKVNFALMDIFEKEGIEFAYPTQTLYMKKVT